MQRAALLPLALLLMLAACARVCRASCNTVFLNKEAMAACGYGGPVSVGSFSEINEFESHVIAGPPGGNLALLDVEEGVPSPLGKSVQIYHGFVCIGHDMTRLSANFPGLPAGTLVCNQGINQRGLAIGIQAQDTALARVLAYDPSGLPGALNWWDVTKFILARYDNVDQVKKAFTKEIQLVYPTGGAWKGGRGPAQWIGVYDANGKAVVVQSRNGTIEVVDNPLGVLANYANTANYWPAPPKFDLLQEQYAKWRAWAKASGYELDADGHFIVGPVMRGFPGVPRITLVNMTTIPGGYDGDTRFIRMAALSSAARLGNVIKGGSCWPNPKQNPTSPAANPNYLKYPNNNPTIMAALAILNTVALPMGLDDHSNAGKWDLDVPEPDRYDATYWYSIRDHENKLFFYRTMNNHVWRMVNLSNPSAFARGFTDGKLRAVRLTSPRQSGYFDVTREFLNPVNI